MGLSYKPVRFDDFTPINHLTLPPGEIKISLEEISLQLAGVLPQGLILLEGYPTARFHKFVEYLKRMIPEMVIIDVSSLYRSPEEIQELLSPYLPQDRDIDPELVFGRIFDQDYLPFFDQEKVKNFINNLPNERQVILYGLGSACEFFQAHAKALLYLDVTPKDAALRLYDGCYQSLGISDKQDLDKIIRQTYFVDVELAVKTRKELVQHNRIDYYLLDSELSMSMLSKDSLNTVFSQLKNRPFRAKPIYIEGVWGGQFIKRYRGIPDGLVDKIAWSFEFIPTEASLLMESNGYLIDIPFLTVMASIGTSIVGEKIYQQFGGNFPVRFNYDDTWHSNGNMSIQCHPNDEMVKEFYGDFAGQNEAYYIVLTGHDAKTFCGFKGNGREFLDLCRQSEKEGSIVPYADYVNAIPSNVGRQFFLPAGTIHSSGRNQVVLELGTFTSNAYTYKIYDYMRLDITGKPRPLHTKLAEQALVFDRDAEWVRENIAFPPKIFSEGEGWQEYLIGRFESIYFETHRIEMETGSTYRGKNTDGFTVITIVDGETARIQSAVDSSFYYDANYLDVVVIPASIRNYEVIGTGKQPVMLHKTFVREDRKQG